MNKAKETQERIAQLFKNPEARIAVAYSGGKDSAVLLDLLKSLKDRVKVAWCNTGYTYPHVVEHIREATKGYDFTEIKHDLMGVWQRDGYPVHILPIEHAGEIYAEPPVPKLQPWTACCMKRMIPMQAYLKREGYNVLLIGQRKQDGFRMRPYAFADGVHALYPLWDWSDQDIWDYRAAHNLSLPDHVKATDTSMGCWSCPAHFGTAEEQFISKHYPAYAPVVKELVQLTIESTSKQLEEIKRAVL